MVFMGLMSAVYLVCALRTNVCFVIIFLTLLLVFGFLGGTYFQLANHNVILAGKLQVVRSLPYGSPSTSIYFRRA